MRLKKNFEDKLHFTEICLIRVYSNKELVLTVQTFYNINSHHYFVLIMSV